MTKKKKNKSNGCACVLVNTTVDAIFKVKYSV